MPHLQSKPGTSDRPNGRILIRDRLVCAPMSRAVWTATLCTALWCSAFALAPIAHAEHPDTAAWNANTGLVWGLGVAILVPDHGSIGGGPEVSARLGIPAGPVIVAPGGRLGGYYLQHHFIGDLMGTFRVTWPLGPFAPFGQGGLGPGIMTNPSRGGLAWLGGGGLMIHFGSIFALGAEINYEGITHTGFKTLSIGPAIVIGG